MQKITINKTKETSEEKTHSQNPITTPTGMATYTQPIVQEKSFFNSPLIVIILLIGGVAGIVILGFAVAILMRK